MIDFPQLKLQNHIAYRLVNSKFPPISLFDDVADQQEFEAVYEIQQITNPRIQNELGNLNLLPKEQIPFGIDGCNYATSPFTHVNPEGSRFSAGDYGVLYLADSLNCAEAETRYHQQKNFQNIVGLHFDTIVMRALKVCFSGLLTDVMKASSPIYHLTDYSDARELGRQQRMEEAEGLQYKSVRLKKSKCWGLFTPRYVHSIVQTKHLEFVYDGQAISDVREISMTSM